MECIENQLSESSADNNFSFWKPFFNTVIDKWKACFTVVVDKYLTMWQGFEKVAIDKDIKTIP